MTRATIEQALGHSLSDEQWTAVSAPPEPGVIVAGAGSGKTTVMSARMLWLVAEGWTTPESLLGLTFTTKAAAELLGRARALVADDGDPVVSTYHSFASRLIDDFGIRLGREPGARVLGPAARHSLGARVVRGTNLPLADLDTSPADVVTAMLALDDSLAELDLTLDVVRDDAIDLVADLAARESGAGLQKLGREMLATARVRAALCGLVEEFREAKARRQVLDFADQVRLALDLARRVPEVVDTIRQRHRFVLLDEYQDTSVAQRRLLQVLFGDGHPVTAVGDPCQAIYEWRGASVDNIENFPEHFPALASGVRRPAHRYSLADNRRSGARILGLANEIAAPLRVIHSGAQALTSGDARLGDGDVVCALLPDASSELRWVADEVEHLRAVNGSWQGIAILARQASTLAAVNEVLRARDIPTHLVGVAGLLEVPVIAEIRAILEVACDPTANASCLRLLSGARWRLGTGDLAVLGRLASALVGTVLPREWGSGADDVARALRRAVLGSDPADRISLVEAVDAVASGSVDTAGLSDTAVTALTELSGELRLLRSHVDEPLNDLISRVVRVSGLGVEMSIGAERDVIERARALASFRDLAADFESSGDASLSAEAAGGLGARAFLAHLREAERFDVAPEQERVRVADAVELMTVHRAKGLEFAHVIIPGMVRGGFPSDQTRPRWPKVPEVVPWSLREDAPPALLAFPDPGAGPRAKDHDAFIAASGVLEAYEERRLAYVAITRAERSVRVSGHWWGPTQKGPRGPGEFLREVFDWCVAGHGSVAEWAVEPEEGSANPLLEQVESRWPVVLDPVHAGHRRWAADQVGEAIGRVMRDPQADRAEADDVLAHDVPMIRQWDELIDALLTESAGTASARPRGLDGLPASLSATDLVRLAEDRDAALIEFTRPMPRRPSSRARLGTAMHRWIQDSYAGPALFDVDELPGSADDPSGENVMVAWQEAFSRTPYADLTPVAVEEPFCIAIAGHVIRGRIDAVFRRGDRFEVVDWKTGGTTGLAPIQLAVYRLAWAQRCGVDVEDVDAAFVMVATGDVVRPEELPDADGLAAVLTPS